MSSQPEGLSLVRKPTAQPPNREFQIAIAGKADDGPAAPWAIGHLPITNQCRKLLVRRVALIARPPPLFRFAVLIF
jgi:hypothetical protein